MASSLLGWTLFVLGLVQIGDGIQAYARHRRAKGIVKRPAPLSSFFLGFTTVLLGLLSIVADRGTVPFWFYLGPLLFFGVSFVRLMAEAYRPEGAPPSPSSEPDTALTRLERGWKVVSLLLSILVMAGVLFVIGTVAGAPVAGFLLLITMAFFLYLAYYKRKYGRPWSMYR